MITKLFEKATFTTFLLSAIISFTGLVAAFFAKHRNWELPLNEWVQIGLIGSFFCLFLFLIFFVEKFQHLFDFKPSHLLSYPLALSVFPVELFELQNLLFVILISLLLNSFKKSVEEENAQKHIFNLTFFVTIISLYDLKWTFLYIFPIGLFAESSLRKTRYLIMFLLPTLFVPFLWIGILHITPFSYHDILKTLPQIQAPKQSLFYQYGAWVFLSVIMIIVAFLAREEFQKKSNTLLRFMKILLSANMFLLIFFHQNSEFWIVGLIPVGFFLGLLLEKTKSLFVKNMIVVIFAVFFVINISTKIT